MVSKVAIVALDEDAKMSFKSALKLIGGLSDLNTRRRTVVIKPGIFDHRKKLHAVPSVVGAIAESFDKAPRVYVAESDNYRGTGTERLRIYNSIFSERIVPFNLTEDTERVESNIAGEKMLLSHVLFKPNVLVSVHILRHAESILKNLFGLTPDKRRVRLHKKLPRVLLDLYEAVDGIDLAVLDGTFAYSQEKRASTKQPIAQYTAAPPLRKNVLIVGRDAVAVEAIGVSIAGLDPKKIPVIKLAMRRGLGEGDIRKVEIVGEPLEEVMVKSFGKK